jgi:hypothetical protein
MSASHRPLARTNLKRDFGNAEDSLCNWIELKCVNVWLGVHLGELTSANTAPYLITLSTPLSIDLLISGEYSFNDSSS